MQAETQHILLGGGDFAAALDYPYCAIGTLNPPTSRHHAAVPRRCV